MRAGGDSGDHPLVPALHHKLEGPHRRRSHVPFRVLEAGGDGCDRSLVPALHRRAAGGVEGAHWQADVTRLQEVLRPAPTLQPSGDEAASGGPSAAADAGGAEAGAKRARCR